MDVDKREGREEEESSGGPVPRKRAVRERSEFSPLSRGPSSATRECY